jgi:hypothetical protein
MPLIEEKFDQHRIDILKRHLQREKEKGRTKDFEILVDGFKVVSRTDDLNEFEDYEQEVKDDTRNVSILIYDGTSTNRNTRYSFSLQRGPATDRGNQPLNGLGEVEQVIAQKLEEREQEHERTRLKEQLTATKEQLAEAEEYAETLEKRIKEMEDKRYTQAVSLGEVASVVLKTLVKEHAARIPGGQALAGLLGADIEETTPAIAQPATEGAASFERQPVTEELTEETRNRLSLIAQMQQRFNEQQMIAVFSIIDHLAVSPDKIGQVITMLGLEATTVPQ